MVKFFIDTDKDKLEEKVNKWLRDNDMEAHAVSFDFTEHEYGCSIICSPISYH